MYPWFQYWFERLPIAAYSLLSVGLACSTLAMSRHLHLVIHPLWTALAALGVFYSLALLRLMDDVKDFEKDCTAHSHRALARGVISLQQAQQMVHLMSFIMASVSLAMLMGGYQIPGICYTAITLYQWLMYREFFIPKLDRFPLLYALSHQAILLPICGYCFALAGNYDIHQILYFSLMMLGSFFCYELCRKLAPHAARSLGYYRAIYGLTPTLSMAFAGCLLSMITSHHIHLQELAWPMEAILALHILYVWIDPDRYKWLEHTAGTSLLVHAWSGSLLNLWMTL